MFRFSIRELFLVTVIVAMGCGWWMDRKKVAARESATVKKLITTEGKLFEI